MSRFETVIGLEVHLQLKTKTKIFCGCANVFGQAPNSQTCPICLGLPGTLPVLNEQALLSAIKVGLALNCRINTHTKFDRKNYYYPDLPKGYQISQYDVPVAENGYVMIKSEQGDKRVNIKRAHLEEDAGKLIHDGPSGLSWVDYNRTGTPLIEIVTEADLRSPQEAYDYLHTLKLILQYLDVSDCDMEKGSLRCDANISIRERGTTQFGTKAEIKNMNSFRAVKAGLEYEVSRQVSLVESGQRVVQETRLWSEEKGVTLSMRSKEEAHDYRYFPDPDLVQFVVSNAMLSSVQTDLPELPHVKLQRLIEMYGLSEYDARIMVQDKLLADFFEACTKLFKETKKISNWIIGPVQQELNERKIRIIDLNLSPETLISLINKVENGALSHLAAKDVFKEMVATGKAVDTIISEKGLLQVSDNSALEQIIQEVISEQSVVVDEIRKGKDSAIGFLVGQAMKKSQGKANPKKLGELLRQSIFS